MLIMKNDKNVTCKLRQPTECLYEILKLYRNGTVKICWGNYDKVLSIRHIWYTQTKSAHDCPIPNGNKMSRGDSRENIWVTYLVSVNNGRMDNRNGKAWQENKRASQTKRQLWDHLLDNFDEYVLREIL